MLSFQKDHESIQPIHQADKPNDTKTTTPITSQANDDSSQYYTVTDKSQQVKRSTYLLIGLFIIGAICLWFMIKKSSPSSALASSGSQKNEQSQIEAAIERITGVRSQMFTGLETIVKKFYEFSDFEQVNVNELSKNPFRIDNTSGNKPSETLSQLAFARNELELLTIMTTENGPCCMINDKLLYQGDSIEGLKVINITEKDVTLSDGEMNIVLKLSETF
jgi:preprotein translocase subunit SecG